MKEAWVETLPISTFLTRIIVSKTNQRMITEAKKVFHLTPGILNYSPSLGYKGRSIWVVRRRPNGRERLKLEAEKWKTCESPVICESILSSFKNPFEKLGWTTHSFKAGCGFTNTIQKGIE